MVQDNDALVRKCGFLQLDFMFAFARQTFTLIIGHQPSKIMLSCKLKYTCQGTLARRLHRPNRETFYNTNCVAIGIQYSLVPTSAEVSAENFSGLGMEGITTKAMHQEPRPSASFNSDIICFFQDWMCQTGNTEHLPKRVK